MRKLTATGAIAAGAAALTWATYRKDMEAATQRIEELLFELKKELTIVIVTHNLQQAGRLSDMTAFFYLGRLVEMDRTEIMFTRPREERTEAYVTGRFG